MGTKLLTTLEKANYNIPCIIEEFVNENHLNIDKLYNIGITKNTKITPLFSSIFNGTRAYLVRGCVVALRNNDAKDIIVNQSE